MRAAEIGRPSTSNAYALQIAGDILVDALDTAVAGKQLAGFSVVGLARLDEFTRLDRLLLVAE
jgi:hypothetical protein